MRVLFISDVYFPRVNGVSTSIRTFREDLERCGVQTLLVAPEYGRADPAAEAGVVRVPSARVPRDPEDRRMRWRALDRALSALDGAQLDLVHVHTPFLAHYAGVRFARRMRLPCIATYHTFFEEYLHHYVPALPRGIGRVLARTLTRSQCADVGALIAPSEPLRQVLLGYRVATPVHVIPTGLPPDRFTPGDGARFRRREGLAPERPLLTYVGRVAHEKNIEFLLHVLAEVRRSEPRAMLVIAGEGPAREPLRRRAASLGLAGHVHWCGYLERATSLLDCYAAASVFVFASRTETQGLVLLEAMAQGVPVVSLAELGARSVLAPDSGALVAEARVEAFAALVTGVLRDEALRRAAAARVRAYARGWSSSAMAARLAELYAALVAERRQPPRVCAPAAADS